MWLITPRLSDATRPKLIRKHVHLGQSHTIHLSASVWALAYLWISHMIRFHQWCFPPCVIKVSGEWERMPGQTEKERQIEREWACVDFVFARSFIMCHSSALAPARESIFDSCTQHTSHTAYALIWLGVVMLADKNKSNRPELARGPGDRSDATLPWDKRPCVVSSTCVVMCVCVRVYALFVSH